MVVWIAELGGIRPANRRQKGLCQRSLPSRRCIKMQENTGASLPCAARDHATRLEGEAFSLPNKDFRKRGTPLMYTHDRHLVYKQALAGGMARRLLATFLSTREAILDAFYSACPPLTILSPPWLTLRLCIACRSWCSGGAAPAGCRGRRCGLSALRGAPPEGEGGCAAAEPESRHLNAAMSGRARLLAQSLFWSMPFGAGPPPSFGPPSPARALKMS